MAELSGLQVFKYLPAAKKLPEGNCKKCGFPTCMAFSLKLAKGQSEIELCPYAPDELKEIFTQSMKQPQKEVLLGHENKVLVGGENVLYRHDKTFINKTAIAVVLDVSKSDWETKLKRICEFEITRIKDVFKVDLIYLKGNITPEITAKLDTVGMPWVAQEDLSALTEVKDTNAFETIEKLTEIRKKAVLEKDENFDKPVYVYFPSFYTSPPAGEGEISSRRMSDRNLGEGSENADDGKIPHQVRDDSGTLLNLMARASFYLCKYANLLIFEDFDEALISTLMTLRQNIFTDPQKPLQVESKVYEFNNADENSLIFLTTNFALTYFAVANEIEALNKPAYLVVTPSDGMSVLTAWSAEKFTAQIAARTIKKFDLANKVKNKKIIIPGLLSHMKKELEESIEDFEILVGPNEAYLLSDFVKTIS